MDIRILGSLKFGSEYCNNYWPRHHDWFSQMLVWQFGDITFLKFEYWDIGPPGAGPSQRDYSPRKCTAPLGRHFKTLTLISTRFKRRFQKICKNQILITSLKHSTHLSPKSYPLVQPFKTLPSLVQKSVKTIPLPSKCRRIPVYGSSGGFRGGGQGAKAPAPDGNYPTLGAF